MLIGYIENGLLLLILMCLSPFVSGEDSTEPLNKIETGRNRSRIHLTIDVEDTNSNKGNQIDLSKGRIKNITIQTDKNKENYKLHVDDGMERDDNKERKVGFDNASGNNNKEHNGDDVIDQNRRRKNLGIGEKLAHNTVQKLGNNQKLKSTKNLKIKGVKKRKDKKKKVQARKGKENIKKRKQPRGQKKKRDSKKQKLSGKQQRKKKKNKKRKLKLKYISNPDGGPNPKNLKIPLTYQRKDIEASSNSSSPTNSIEEGTETFGNANLSDVKKLRKLTKQIVVATLKETSRMINQTKEVDLANGVVPESNAIMNQSQQNISSPITSTTSSLVRMRKDKREMP